MPIRFLQNFLHFPKQRDLVLFQQVAVVENFTDPNQDNWNLLSFHTTDGKGQYQTGEPLPVSWRRYNRISQSPYPITVHSPQDSFDSIIGNISNFGDVGDNARLNENGQWVYKKLMPSDSGSGSHSSSLSGSIVPPLLLQLKQP